MAKSLTDFEPKINKTNLRSDRNSFIKLQTKKKGEGKISNSNCMSISNNDSAKAQVSPKSQR